MAHVKRLPGYWLAGRLAIFTFRLSIDAGFISAGFLTAMTAATLSLLLGSTALVFLVASRIKEL